MLLNGLQRRSAVNESALCLDAPEVPAAASTQLQEAREQKNGAQLFHIEGGKEHARHEFSALNSRSFPGSRRQEGAQRSIHTCVFKEKPVVAF